MPSFKNTSTGDVVTFDDKTGTATDKAIAKASIADLSKSDRWEKVDDPKPTPTTLVVEKPGEKATLDELRKFALAHASDEEKAALDLMNEDALRLFVAGKDGDGLAAGPAAGV